MSDELVSIGMPVFNGERFLESAIASNLAQSHQNIELIIADNASTDRTAEICQAMAASDSRIKYLRNEENIGAANNYRKLVAQAKGRFFRWTNADDLISPELVETLLPVLMGHDDVVIAFGKTQLIDAEGKVTGDYDDDVDLQQENPSERYEEFYRRSGLTNIIYGLMRTSAMQKTDLMGSGTLPAGDVSFLAAMSLQGKFVRVPETLFYRRIHEEAFSSNPDPEAQATFWSASSKRVRMGNWRAFLADYAAIASLQASLGEKARLTTHWSKRMMWRRRDLFRDIRDIFQN